MYAYKQSCERSSGCLGGGTMPCATCTYMVEMIVSTPNSSSASADASVFSKEHVDTLCWLMS